MYNLVHRNINSSEKKVAADVHQHVLYKQTEWKYKKQSQDFGHYHSLY